MQEEQEILKSRLIQLLELFIEKSNKKNTRALESLADSLLQIIYDGNGNDLGIVQFDAAKGLEPFMYSMISDLKSENSNPVKFTLDHFKRVQKVLHDFNVTPSNEDLELADSLENLEEMLEEDEVDVKQLSAVMQQLNQRLTEFPDKESTERMFKSVVSKLGGNSEPKDSLNLQEILRELTRRISSGDELSNFEEMAEYLKSNNPNLFGPSDQDMKKKYDESARLSISKALKDNGFK